MTHGYTTIEQSKNLLSLGLDPSTADMYYCIWRKPSLFVGSYERANFINGNNKAVPAWSLEALLESMPVNIMNYNNGIKKNYSLNLFRSYYYCCGYYYAPSLKEENEDLLCCFGSKESWIDAVYKTVIWCIEQGHIKVNK